MKKRMKRYISAMLCTVMLTICAVPVQAADCSHNYSIKETVSTYYTYINSTKHRAETKIFQHCSNCGYTLGWYLTNTVEEKHSYTYLSEDSGHVSTFVHRYIYMCACGDKITRDVACPPGCLG